MTAIVGCAAVRAITEALDEAELPATGRDVSAFHE
jgi:hypothetical protein